MLCFEVSKNGEKLARAGLRESGVLSLILSWVGREQGASALAAARQGPISGLDFSVAGIDSGDRSVAWIESADLRVGDAIHVRLVSGEGADAPTRSEPSKPVSKVEEGARVIECSFCGEMRQAEPDPTLGAGIAGASVFICLRCIVLAERLLDERLPQLFHLERAADQTCSFCGTDHTEESATARTENMCRSCVDMIMKGIEPAK